MRHNGQLVRISKSLSVWAAVLGVVLFFSSYALAIISDWRIAWERCNYVPMPAAAVLSEVSLIDTFPTAFPIGYGCTWTAVSGERCHPRSRTGLSPLVSSSGSYSLSLPGYWWHGQSRMHRGAQGPMRPTIHQHTGRAEDPLAHHTNHESAARTHRGAKYIPR